MHLVISFCLPTIGQFSLVSSLPMNLEIQCGVVDLRAISLSERVSRDREGNTCL